MRWFFSAIKLSSSMFSHLIHGVLAEQAKKKRNEAQVIREHQRSIVWWLDVYTLNYFISSFTSALDLSKRESNAVDQKQNQLKTAAISISSSRLRYTMLQFQSPICIVQKLYAKRCFLFYRGKWEVLGRRSLLKKVWRTVFLKMFKRNGVKFKLESGWNLASGL